MEPAGYLNGPDDHEAYLVTAGGAERTAEPARWETG